jgi:hypothetical protein
MSAAFHPRHQCEQDRLVLPRAGTHGATAVFLHPEGSDPIRAATSLTQGVPAEPGVLPVGTVFLVAIQYIRRLALVS